MKHFKKCVIIVIFLSGYIQLIKGLRILAIFPFQMHSMNVLCEEMMRGLASRGHQVDVYSHFPPKEFIPRFNHFNLKGTLPALTNNVTLKEVATSKPFDMFLGRLKILGEDQCNLLSHQHFQNLFRNPPKNPPYDLVIIELTYAFCYLAWGRYLQIPVISILLSALPDWHVSSFGVPLNLAVDSTFFQARIPPMTFYERLNNVVDFYVTNHYFEKAVRKQDIQVEKYFGQGYPSVIDLQKEISLVFLNQDPLINGMRAYPPLVVPIGGLHIVDRNENLTEDVENWLDESKDGFIYFSFGSMIRIETLSNDCIEAFYKSFEKIKPVRVLMKIAKSNELPTGLPSNVMTQTWLPQIQILKHKNIKAFMSHGGLLGTFESVYFGVPMIGIPIFYDHHLIIERYVKHNVAIKIDYNEISEKTLLNGFNCILKNTTYKESVQRMKNKFRDRPITPMDNAAFWVKFIHRHGKDALKSPIIDIPWWQANLLDVYSFIIILVFLTLYFKVISVTKIFSHFVTKEKLKIKAH